MINKHTKLRKRLSYFLFPAMIIFTLNPGFLYAETVYVGGKGNIAKDNTGSEFSVSHTAVADMKTAGAVNKVNAVNAGSKANDEQKPSPSSSNAANYTLGVNGTVNTQTGHLDLDLSNVHIPGIIPDISLDLGLSNGGGSDSIYDLPPGYKFNIDYIDTSDSNNLRLHFDSSSNYQIIEDHTAQKAYLQYCKNESIQFDDVVLSKGTAQPLPYDSSLTYKYLLTFLTKDPQHPHPYREYFDSDGKLICQDDISGNHIIYTYAWKPNHGVAATVFNVQLKQITDSYGHSVTFYYTGAGSYADNLKIGLPDGRNVNYTFNDQQVTVLTATGRKVLIKSTTLQDTGQKVVTEIDYPTGGITRYLYDAQIPYEGGHFDAVSDAETFLSASANGDPVMHTHYNYTPDGQTTSFAGPPNKYLPDADCLMELTQGYNSYFYTTEVTQYRSADNGGSETRDQTFNFLHLPGSTVINFTNKKGVRTISTTDTTYLGEKDGHFDTYANLAPNYNLPASIVSKIGDSTIAKVDTNYDDNGQPLSVTQYTNGKVTAVTTNTYFGADKYYQLDTSSVEDKIDGTTITTINTPSDDGKYIVSSRVEEKGFKDKVTTATEDKEGRPLTSGLSFVHGGSSLKDGPSSTSITTSYHPSSSGNDLTIQTTDALDNSTYKDIDTTDGRVQSEKDGMGYDVTYKYENNGLIVTKTYPDQSTETVDNSDPNKTVTSYSNGFVKTDYLDGLGRVIKETVKYPGESEQTVMTKTYNMMGKVATETDIHGNLTAYTYDDWKGRLTSTKAYLNGDSGAYNETDISYDDVNLTSTTTVNNVLTTEKQSDTQGNVLQAIDYTSGIGNTTPVSISTYNGKHEEITNALTMTQGNFASTNGNSLMSTDTTYDLSGKPHIVNLFTQDGTKGKAVSTRDVLGDLIQKTITFSSVSPGVVQGTGELDSEVKKYDGDGHVEQLTNQNGQSMYYTYNKDGKVASMTDFAGDTFMYSYNSMGEMTVMTDASNGLTQTNTYYPANDNSMRAGKIESKTISYAAGGDSDTISYTYDNRGNLSTKTMNGITMHLYYDKFNNVTSMVDFAGNTTTYEYNYADGPHHQDGVDSNDIMFVKNNYGSVTFQYYPLACDPVGAGRTIAEAEYSNGIHVKYDYYGIDSNADGKKKAPKLGFITIYGSDNKIISKTAYRYDPNNPDMIKTLITISETDPDNPNCNYRKDYTYNDMNQLIRENIHTADSSGILGEYLQVVTYFYDINGNIKSRFTTDVKTGSITSDNYTYNSIDQLTDLKESVNNGLPIYKHFVYDNGQEGNGNMTEIDKMKKDQAGDLIKDSVLQNFVYNVRNQLVEYKNAQGVDLHFDYNAEGLRKDKYIADSTGKPSSELTYFYSGAKLINTSDLKGNMSSYLMAGGKRILRTVNYKDGTTPDLLQYYISNGKDVIGIANAEGTGYAQDNSNGSKVIYNYTAYGKDQDLSKIING